MSRALELPRLLLVSRLVSSKTASVNELEFLGQTIKVTFPPKREAREGENERSRERARTREGRGGTIARRGGGGRGGAGGKIKR